MKLLFVARHFPPAVSGGAARPYLLARELLARGHAVTVIAPAPMPGIPVVVVPHRHVDPELDAPRQSGGTRAWLRNWMVPDPDIRWAIAASRATGLSAPDWVITTSPPESSHVAGWLLKRRFGCRWLVDFRDHWFDSPLLPLRREKGMRVGVERWMARRLLRRVDALATTTALIADEVSLLAPAGTPVAVIEHVADAPGAAVTFEEGLVHIVHTGSFALSDPERRLQPVLEGFAANVDARLRLHLVGRLRADEQSLVAASPRIIAHGLVGYEKARAFQAAADILLLVTAPDTPHVPGKLAEYRAAGKPVLAIGGGAWQSVAGIAATNDPREAFQDPIRTVAPPPRSTPGAAADRLLALIQPSV